jgi:hypothetical protein
MSLFRRGPKLHQCFYCSEAIPEPEKRDHYETHLIEVTDVNGQRAFTFDCPSCGRMDQAWGGGRPRPEMNAVSAMQVHLMQRHGIVDL